MIYAWCQPAHVVVWTSIICFRVTLWSLSWRTRPAFCTDTFSKPFETSSELSNKTNCKGAAVEQVWCCLCQVRSPFDCPINQFKAFVSGCGGCRTFAGRWVVRISFFLENCSPKQHNCLLSFLFCFYFVNFWRPFVAASWLPCLILCRRTLKGCWKI